MATQVHLPTMAPTLLERVNTAIKLRQEEHQELEEAFTRAEHKYHARLDAMDYELETLRRVKEQLTNRE